MYRWHEVVSGSWSSWAWPFPAAGPTTYSQLIGIILQWRSNPVKSYRYIFINHQNWQTFWHNYLNAAWCNKCAWLGHGGPSQNKCCIGMHAQVIYTYILVACHYYIKRIDAVDWIHFQLYGESVWNRPTQFILIRCSHAMGLSLHSLWEEQEQG